MPEDLESALKEQVVKVKALIDSSSLTAEQKAELKKYVHQRDFLITSFPLAEKQIKQLNTEFQEAYRIYDAAYGDAKRCLAISEWMTEPTTIIYNIWKSLIE